MITTMVMMITDMMMIMVMMTMVMTITDMMMIMNAMIVWIIVLAM